MFLPRGLFPEVDFVAPMSPSPTLERIIEELRVETAATRRVEDFFTVLGTRQISSCQLLKPNVRLVDTPPDTLILLSVSLSVGGAIHREAALNSKTARLRDKDLVDFSVTEQKNPNGAASSAGREPRRSRQLIEEK